MRLRGNRSGSNRGWWSSLGRRLGWGPSGHRPLLFRPTIGSDAATWAEICRAPETPPDPAAMLPVC
eukprot:11019568-Alexandrium_andersonii.AAC.1